MLHLSCCTAPNVISSSSGEPLQLVFFTRVRVTTVASRTKRKATASIWRRCEAPHVTTTLPMMITTSTSTFAKVLRVVNLMRTQLHARKKRGSTSSIQPTSNHDHEIKALVYCCWRGGQREFYLGLKSERLVYTNGDLILRYTNGQNYSSGQPRNTEIIFICDKFAGAGSPQHTLEEGDKHYYMKSSILVHFFQA